mmetsp:Transcript_93951/g.265746  ORF Transcript_93951/g.265746 Transcript_93951/m.265746 type:complete len:92 (-) Transcript_93951:75-350(-)
MSCINRLLGYVYGMFRMAMVTHVREAFFRTGDQHDNSPPSISLGKAEATSSWPTTGYLPSTHGGAFAIMAVPMRAFPDKLPMMLCSIVIRE